MKFEKYLIESGGGQYFSPEEEKLFSEKTKEALNKLLKMGWKIQFEQPSASGTLYRLWDKGRSRALYLR